MAVNGKSSEENVVLLPIDDSDHSLRAFNWYLEYFHRPDHMIGFAHVYTFPKQSSFSRRHGEMSVECQQYTQEVKEVHHNHAALVKKYQDICKEKGLSNREFCKEKKGSVGEAICELAKENNVCCIVMGKRAMGAIKRALQGSVSEYVLHNSHTTVMIVPAEKK